MPRKRKRQGWRGVWRGWLFDVIKERDLGKREDKSVYRLL